MGFFADVWNILRQYYPFLLKGVGYTLLISLIGTVAGFIIGLLTGMLRTAPMPKNPVGRVFRKILDGIITVYVEVFRGTPMMVQAMVIYWGYAFASGGSTLPLIPSGILIVSINTGAYMAEIVRGGIISIDKGQFEGATSIGMSHSQTMINVILPQVIRNILPSVSNEFVINIKDTSVLNVIGVTEGIYNDTVAISKESPYYTPELIDALQQCFINIINTDEGQAIFSVYSHTGYAIAKDSDYDGARAALAVVS